MKTLNTYFYNEEQLMDFVQETDFQDSQKEAKSVLIQVFSGIPELPKLREILSILNKVCPNHQIIGATTAGEIMDGKMSQEKVVLSFTFFEQTSVNVELVKYEEIPNENDVISHIDQNFIRPNTKGILTFMDFETYRTTQILKGLSDLYPDLPVFGGIAGDNLLYKNQYVFTNEAITSQGAVFALMHSDSLQITTDYHLNWEPIGKKFTVSKAEKNILQEIDGMPAAEVYEKYLGKAVMNNFPLSGLEFPLIFHQDGTLVARAIGSATPEKALVLGATIEQGDVFQFSYGHLESILQERSQLVHKVANIPVESIWLFSCIVRLSFLRDSMQLELNPFKALAPSVGFFTYGEFYHGDSCNLLLNETLTMAILSENTDRLPSENIEKANTQIATDKPDKKTIILQALNKLITTVTSELNTSNTELNQANEELKTILERLQEHTHTIEKMHENMTSSIQYARRIQQALLPSLEELKSLFPESFVFYRPRDIVSGDFYWLKTICRKMYLVVADCTGHGVPGAFMSVLGMNFLDEIITELDCKNAGEILDQLRIKIKSALRQKGKINESKDGMDLALCIMDLEQKKVEFSGAYNSLYLVRSNSAKQPLLDTSKFKTITSENHTLFDIKADKQPIAIYRNEKPFSTQVIDLQKDDQLYLFSDGFADQIGGEENRKYLSKNFKRLLLEIYPKSCTEQYQILEETLQEWQGETKQVDDIIVMGLKIGM